MTTTIAWALAAAIAVLINPPHASRTGSAVSNIFAAFAEQQAGPPSARSPSPSGITPIAPAPPAAASPRAPCHRRRRPAPCRGRRQSPPRLLARALRRFGGNHAHLNAASSSTACALAIIAAAEQVAGRTLGCRSVQHDAHKQATFRAIPRPSYMPRIAASRCQRRYQCLLHHRLQSAELVSLIAAR